MVEQGLKATGYEEVGLLSLSSADHSEIGQLARDSPTATRAPTASACPRPASTPSTSPWPTSCPATDGAAASPSPPRAAASASRRVINKTVSKEDLVRTVTTAYANSWRQVKLYFMCGLPTETDEDVLEIADLAVEVIKARPRGQRAEGRPLHRVHRRVRAQAAHPFQWAGQASAETDRPPAPDPPPEDQRGPRIGVHRPALPRRQAGVIEGLLSRGDRRVGQSSSGSGARAASSTAGASTSPSTAGPRRRRRNCSPSASTSTGSPP